MLSNSSLCVCLNLRCHDVCGGAYYGAWHKSASIRTTFASSNLYLSSFLPCVSTCNSDHPSMTSETANLNNSQAETFQLQTYVPWTEAPLSPDTRMFLYHRYKLVFNPDSRLFRCRLRHCKNLPPTDQLQHLPHPLPFQCASRLRSPECWRVQ